MKRNYILILVSLAFTCGIFCACGKKTELEDGVGRKLAIDRKSDISDVVYRLRFALSEDRGAAFPSSEEISFVCSGEKDLVIDFKESSESLHSVAVNGKDAEFSFENEHIVIPASCLKEGKNTVSIGFDAGKSSLNHNGDYLYTLLVPDRARTLFPCFDQPDMKAEYHLTLDIPENWTALSNSPVKGEELSDGRRIIEFGGTEPLSTYLFSFVAGEFKSEKFVLDASSVDSIHVYHRLEDKKELAQLKDIADIVEYSLSWLEDYTGIEYPFAKYDLVIMPGFQYGGMEHTGATLYNDKRMILPDNPTESQKRSRLQLIAHETAHMWFGDYVTMKWFDDVWTKEVFANFFADRITSSIMEYKPDNLDFAVAAYAEDRTEGTTSIKQNLPNLKYAGLVYGQIVYQKSPVVMNMLAAQLGEDAFRKGIREYLGRFAYANSDWNELIDILAAYSKEGKDLKEWSRVWVSTPGRPHIKTDLLSNGFRIVQLPQKNNTVWPQTVKFDVFYSNYVFRRFSFDLENDTTLYISSKFAEGAKPLCILPNMDGNAYGYFELDSVSVRFVLENLDFLKDAVSRRSALVNLRETMLEAPLDSTMDLKAIVSSMFGYMKEEGDIKVFNTMSGIVGSALSIMREKEGHGLVSAEELLSFNVFLEEGYMSLVRENKGSEFALSALRNYISCAYSDDALSFLYGMWNSHSSVGNVRLNDNDYKSLSYKLALRYPEKASCIVGKQRERISGTDRLREYDFVSRAVTGGNAAADSLFMSFAEESARRPEPWVQSALSLLNDYVRSDYAVKYIRPGLELLEEIQRTGDIFFPKGWVSSLLGGHKSDAAENEVYGFLEDNPEYPELLKNKILQAL